MAEPQAQWALMSKHPGDPDDYRVLACSQGPFQSSDFERLISRYLPGTPPAPGQGQPDSLPWITFSPGEHSGASYAGLAILEWSDQLDWSSRPIAPTRYFCLPFATAAEARATYASLYAAVATLDLPRPSASPLPLRPAPLDAGAIAARIEELGFDWVAAAAARLLHGPVALLGAGALAPAQRLDCLDAIAALLPYGFRAELAASTWADSSSLHRIRLAFSRRARAEQQAMAWGSRAAPAVGANLSGEYLSLLQRLRDRRGTQAIVGYLAADRAPHSFDRAGAALERLQQLDRPYAVWRRARQGTAAPGELRELLSGGDHAALTVAERIDVLRCLLRLGDPGDIPLLRHYWLPELLPSLVDLARPLLPAPDARPAFAQYMAIAEDHGLLEPFLCGLLAGEQAPGRQVAATEDAVIRLLRAVAAPAPGTWEDLRGRLLQRRRLAYELLAQEIELGGSGRLPAMLAWLQRDEPARRALRPFHLAVSHDASPALSGAEVAAVAGEGQRYALALLEAARSWHRAGAVIPALTAWAAQVAPDLPAGAAGHWEPVLARVTAADAGEQARIDLLRLLLGLEPAQPLRRVLLDGGEPAARAYLEAFGAARGSAELRAAGPLLLQRLASYVAGQQWTEPEPLAGNALALLRLAAAPEPPATVEPAAAVVAGGVAANPELTHLRQYQQWWRAMVRRFPGPAARARAAELRQELRRATSPEEAAALCATALRDGADEAAVLAALRGYDRPLPEQWVNDLLRELLRRLLPGDARGKAAWSVYFNLVGAVLRGELGGQLAASYRAWLAARAPVEIYRWVELLGMVRDTVAEQDLPLLSAAEQQLHDAARQSGRWWRRRT